MVYNEHIKPHCPKSVFCTNKTDSIRATPKEQAMSNMGLEKYKIGTSYILTKGTQLTSFLSKSTVLQTFGSM